MRSNDIQVRPVDPSDDAAIRAYHETFSRASEAGRTDPTIWSLDYVRVHLRELSTVHRIEVYVAMDGETPVGAGDLDFPLLDNPTLAEFDLAVLPEHRRRGIGTALFDYVSARAKANGRDMLATEISVTVGTEHEAPGAPFLTKRGLTLRNTEIRRQLKLPVDDGKLGTLAAKAADRTDGYRVLTWTGRCPEEYAEQYAQLKGLLVAEAPMGGSERQPENWDVARLREGEQKADVAGRTLHTSVAVAPDGTLAGHTQLSVPADEPGRAYQWDTLVLDSHRGHRLGLALKVANLRSLQATHPDVNRIETWNAEQNGPMVNVNVQLGFEIIELCQGWEGNI